MSVFNEQFKGKIDDNLLFFFIETESMSRYSKFAAGLENLLLFVDDVFDCYAK